MGATGSVRVEQLVMRGTLEHNLHLSAAGAAAGAAASAAAGAATGAEAGAEASAAAGTAAGAAADATAGAITSAEGGAAPANGGTEEEDGTRQQSAAASGSLSRRPDGAVADGGAMSGLQCIECDVTMAGRSGGGGGVSGGGGSVSGGAEDAASATAAGAAYAESTPHPAAPSSKALGKRRVADVPAPLAAKRLRYEESEEPAPVMAPAPPPAASVAETAQGQSIGGRTAQGADEAKVHSLLRSMTFLRS